MLRAWDKSKPPTGPFSLNRDCPQAQGLVAWYPMGGPSARGVVFDIAGAAHLSGTVNAMTLGDAGQPATTFVSASTQFLSVSSVPASAYPLTIAAWARPATVHSGCIAGIGRSAGAATPGRKLIFAHSAGNIRAYNENDSASSVFPISSGSYAAGGWVHAAGVFDSSNTTAFRNGANKASLTSPTFGTPDKTRIGHDVSTGNYFDGDVGETGFWSVALSDNLVYRLYDRSTRYELWYPLRSRKWFSLPAASGLPTLSNARATSITTTTAVPAVDYAY